jgi:hypothetical protein
MVPVLVDGRSDEQLVRQVGLVDGNDAHGLSQPNVDCRRLKAKIEELDADHARIAG